MISRLPDHNAEKKERMLYSLRRGNVARASEVLADAFQHDPLWNKIYERESHLEKRLRVAFGASVRYCLKYGEVYAPSEDLEGVMGFVPGEYADMSVWRMLCSGSISSVMRMGLNTTKKMAPIFKLVSEDRCKHMAGHSYLHLSVVGVDTALQGMGFGRKLIGAAIDKSQREDLQLYLETETEENMKMYEHFGFRLLNKITLPIVDLPMWEMVRDPQT
jgi:ribosomal protein S18 acetylase RimI-like enzyme